MTKNIFLIIFSLFFLAYIIADCFFRESAFESSNTFASNFQETLNSSFFKYFFIIFCDILHPIVLAALMIVFYSISPMKIKSLAFLLYFFLITYILSILKIIYNDPRPYWSDDRVKAFECYSEYGNPSGHSMMAALIFGMFWERFVFDRTRKKKVDEDLIENENLIMNNYNEKINYFFIGMTIIISFIVIFILLGRIYLGMHSYNEVILGFLYGLYFIYIYSNFLERYFIDFVDWIIIKNDEDFKAKDQKYFSFVVFILLSSFYFTFIFISIFTFEISKSHINIPKQWDLNIAIYCPDNNQISKYYYRCFIDSGISGSLMGALFGILCTKGEYCPSRTKYIKKNYIIRENNTNKNFKNHFFRTCLMLVICGGISGVFKLIPANNSSYIAFFINNSLGTFCGTFALIKIMPFIYWKLKLDWEDDFLKYSNGDLVIKEKLVENFELTSKENKNMEI